MTSLRYFANGDAVWPSGQSPLLTHYLTPKAGLFEELPTVSEGLEKTQREELQCQVEMDTAGGLAVEAVRVLFVASVRKGAGKVDSGDASVPRD